MKRYYWKIRHAVAKWSIVRFLHDVQSIRECRAILIEELDRDTSEDSLRTLCVVSSNALHWAKE